MKDEKVKRVYRYKDGKRVVHIKEDLEKLGKVVLKKKVIL